VALLTLWIGSAAQAHQEDAAPELRLDKPAQHRAGILTLRVEAAAPLVRLPAVVVADPRRELRIAATQDGIVEPAGRALPLPGEAVQAGQVLAWLRPVLSQPDRSDMNVDLTVAQRDLKQGRIQIKRYGINENQHLDVKLSTPTVDIITRYHSGQIRNEELVGALDKRIPLVAPRSGTILRSLALAGTVSATGQTLFEINAPGALAVEAEYADNDIDADAVQQALTADGRSLPLHFLGLSYDAALRSHRALYAVAADAGLSVNQALLLNAPRESGEVPSYAIPESALFQRDGHSWVWLHRNAQQFQVRQVSLLQAGGAGTVLIGSGLHPGERVVAQGVDALNAAAHAGQDAP
jgi:hypothetical protein